MAVIFDPTKRWTKKTLTYCFSNTYSGGGNFTQQDPIADFQKACEAWSGPTGINFQQTQNGSADITVNWAALDGPGDVLGRSGIPDGKDSPIQMTFDTAEDWTANKVLLTAVNFFSVALHELGHAIGLNHSANSAATMYPMHLDFFVARTALATDDIDGAKFLYGLGTSEGIFMVNETDRNFSYFIFNGNDTLKWTALTSGNMAPGEMTIWTGADEGKQYFVRITRMGGGAEYAGALVRKNTMVALTPVGSGGLYLAITG